MPDLRLIPVLLSLTEQAAVLLQASAFQLRLQREAEAKEREKAAAAKAAQAKRTVSEQDYSQIVEVPEP